ncbi:MAG: lipopolysaccharide transport periplasmic protein LptA [Oleibacter sp.]|nr:lipopolysaccharide transport periplasmic protein LptA [Thalassolituus sp.]
MMTSLSQALPQDWKKEMVILSDRADIDRRAGTVIYEGDVLLTQGTLKIQAQRLTIYRNAEGLEKVVAEGTPATYQQQIEVDKPITNAKGDRIDYFTLERRITLRGDAELEQAGNVFSGNLITYDMTDETVKAVGTNSVSDQTERAPDGRIKVIIQPQSAPGNQK